MHGSVGPAAFPEIGGEVVQSTAFVLQNTPPQGRTGTYFRLVDEKSASAKRDAFETGKHRYPGIDQQDFEMIPGAPIAYWADTRLIQSFSTLPPLSEVAPPRKGFDPGGGSKDYFRQWYEVSIGSIYEGSGQTKNNKWVLFNKGGGGGKWFGDRNFIVWFGHSGGGLYNKDGANIRNKESYFTKGLTYSVISSDTPNFRTTSEEYIFYQHGATCVIEDNETRLFILALLNSPVTDYALKAINPTLSFTVGDVGKVPIISDLKESALEPTDECLSIAANDYNSRKDSRGFYQHSLLEQHSSSLQAAYESWQQKSVEDFLNLHANEEELNKLFIELYGLEDELSPRVALDDITILEDELDRTALEELDDERDDLSDDELRQRFLEDDPNDALFQVEVPIRQFLSYGVGVMLGRYRLGHDGLHIAHPNPSSDELAPYEVPVPLSGSESNDTEQFEIDDDAIVPLMGRDSPFSDDAVVRMRDIVRLVWGEETLTENLNFINHALSVGRSRGLKRDYEKTMEEWLVGDFWDWHKSLYSVPYYGKKPIYWLFQSPEGHFQVLVYMHRMDKYTPQRVRQDYLQRYQEWLRREIESLEAKGEETLSTDQSKRLDTLRAAAADCRDYDAILKDVADQQIEIDLDDGVQNNYPKFGDAVAAL